MINSYNYKAAISYIQGRNDSNSKEFYTEPECFAKHFYYKALMQEITLKEFYDDYIIGCDLFLEIVKV